MTKALWLLFPEGFPGLIIDVICLCQIFLSRHELVHVVWNYAAAVTAAGGSMVFSVPSVCSIQTRPSG